MRVPILDINRKELSDPRRFAGFENGITLALLEDESPYFSRRQPANPAGPRGDSAPNSHLILFGFIHPDKRENVPSSARQASPPEVCSLVRATAASRSSPSKGLRSTSVTPVSPAVSRRAVTTSTGTFASVADPAR